MKKFFEHGRLGDISLGQTREYLINRVGKTDCTAPFSRKNKKTAIMKCGDIEFHFDEADKIAMIFSDTFDNKIKGARRLRIDSGPVSRHWTIEEARSFFKRENMNWSESGDTRNEGHVNMKLDSHVVLNFCVVKKKDCDTGLCSIILK